MIFAVSLAFAAPVAEPPKTYDCYQKADETPAMALTPEDIDKAEVSFDPQSSEPTLLIDFSESGNARFVKLQQGRLGKKIAIYFDDKLISEPVLQEYVTGGSIQISGGFSVEEATEMAVRLNGGDTEN